MEKYNISYGNENIEFFVERKNIKNVNLNVNPDSSVIVRANENVPIEFIESFVKSKSRWILNNQSYFNKVKIENTNKREFVSGESIKYLGKQYRLKVFKSDTESVKYLRGYICLYIKDINNLKKKKKLFETWIDDRCKVIFEEIFNAVYIKLSKYGVPRPSIKIRNMKSRWGSCIKDKETIILNKELIKAPKYCIEYVVLHELIHFIYTDHNNKFYEFLSVIMPDWKERKKILDEEVVKDL